MGNFFVFVGIETKERGVGGGGGWEGGPRKGEERERKRDNYLFYFDIKSQLFRLCQVEQLLNQELTCLRLAGT